jgi:hypothetical protein
MVYIINVKSRQLMCNNVRMTDYRHVTGTGTSCDTGFSCFERK